MITYNSSKSLTVYVMRRSINKDFQSRKIVAVIGVCTVSCVTRNALSPSLSMCGGLLKRGISHVDELGLKDGISLAYTVSV